MNEVLTATAESAKKRINYKSDFDFLLHLYEPLRDGETERREIAFPDYDFQVVLTIGASAGFSSRKYIASQVGGKLTNCYNDNGVIHVVCDNHGLLAGQVYVEFHANVPNGIYPDGKELTVTPSPIGIELVADAGDTPTEIDVDVVMPIIYRDAYALAVASGYTGSYQEYVDFILAKTHGVVTLTGTNGSAVQFGMFSYKEVEPYYGYYSSMDEGFIIGEFD